MKHLTNFLLVISFFAISTALYAAGEVKINTDLTVESDGTLVSSGNATVWNDINIYPDAFTSVGSTVPTQVRFKRDAGNSSQGVLLWSFSNSTEQEVYFQVQLPHGYKEGTTLYPHVHWTTFSTDPTGSVVEWALEYTVMKMGGTFSTTTIISGYTPVSVPTGAGQHTVTSLGTIASGTTPNNLEISTVLVCRLFRNSANNPLINAGVDRDTYAAGAGLLGFDIHYESDLAGSRSITTK